MGSVLKGFLTTKRHKSKHLKPSKRNFLRVNAQMHNWDKQKIRLLGKRYWLVEKVNGNTIKESTKKVTKTEIYL